MTKTCRLRGTRNIACGLLWQTESWSSTVIVFVEGLSELVLSGESKSHVSIVTCWLSRPKVALPVTLWSRLLQSCVEGTRATLSRFRSASSLLALALQEPTRVELPPTHVPTPAGTESITWDGLVLLLEQGTMASMVMVVRPPPRWWSNRRTWSSFTCSGGGFWWGKRVAWFTIDSNVPPPRGFSHWYLFTAAEPTGFAGTRGGPRPCMASWPFSHVSSATS